MSDDLQQLKLVNGWLLDRVSQRFPCGVRQYTMVEFNDPAVGPVKYTVSKSEFGDFFNNIKVYGGGDCPELAVAGLELALKSSPQNSFILVLTDASAKDYNNATLVNDVYSLIAEKQSQVYFLITNLCSGVYAPDFMIYREIAQRSFGHVFEVSLSELGKVMYYLDFTLSRPVNSSRRLFSKEYNGGKHADNFSVTDIFTALIVTTDGVFYSIKLTGPDSSDVKTKVIVSETWGSMHLVKKPTPGNWKMNVHVESSGSVRVEGFQATNTTSAVNCSQCHPYATCEEYLNIQECSCNDGFIGDGSTCSDIDECEYDWSNNCSSPFSVCTNTFGSYRCDCISGYTKNSSNECFDPNECLNSSHSRCDGIAKCMKTNSNWSCSCPPGYYGDGFHCEIDECTNNVCGQGMECIKQKGSYQCSDPCFNHTILEEPWRSMSNPMDSHYCDIDKFGWYRFLGSGGIRMSEICVPQERCGTSAPMWISGTHPILSDRIVNRTACAHWNNNCCQWSTSVQIKACPGGYHVYNLHGTPFCRLAYCTDPSSLNDSCSLCASDEECRLVDGKYGCYCKARHEIVGIEDLDVDLICNQHEMKASVRTCQLKSLHLNTTSVHLADNNCVGFKDVGKTSLISAVSPLKVGKCGTQLSRNKTHAIYSNTLHVSLETNQIIMRNQEFQVRFACAYPLDMKLSLETSLKPVLSAMSFTLEGTGTFTMQMAVYKDQSFLSPYEGKEIALSTQSSLYVGVILDEPDTSQYAVVMKNCYATPTRNADDPVKYYIIKDRCPNKQDSSIRVFENGVSAIGKFSVQMFKFVGDYDRVYLHCEINLCNITTGMCQPTCSGIRPRIFIPETDYALFLGPIILGELRIWI
ncbi:uromodulin-like [Bombina bombina]|uniref:uromodulin-like n=1 Tax=Bombina bombina TaxID=8345 RepID=UPI00235B0C6C|nr:uromodulin-like [Bombina bombina]